VASNDDPFAALESFGGFLGGLARSAIPQDTPEGQMLAAQSQLSDLRKQENELLLQIGREAYRRDPSAWSQDARLQLIAQNVAAAEGALTAANTAKDQAEAAQAIEDAKGRCPSCRHKNPEEVRFCQKCGTSLAATAPQLCACGVELAPDVRFCGSCGARREG